MRIPFNFFEPGTFLRPNVTGSVVFNDGTQDVTATMQANTFGNDPNDSYSGTFYDFEYGANVGNPTIPDIRSFIGGTGVGVTQQYTITFDVPVNNLVFDIGSIDQSGGADNLVTVNALDANGNPVTVQVSGNTHHTITPVGSGVSIDGEADSVPNSSLLGDADSVTITIPGPVTQVTIFHEAGPDGSTPNGIGLGNFAIVCFGRGTRIVTPQGEKLIEDLEPGDLVQTLDAGLQPIRWIGSTVRGKAALTANPKLRPVRITAGALGNGLPQQDLVVSRQHRVLIRSRVAMRMFGSLEVLIPAIKLLGLPGVEVDQNIEQVEYFHILFDDHQIVFSNGAPTESLFTGPEALKAVSAEAREEITELFPEIVEPDFDPSPARLIPETGKEIKKLVERLIKNNKIPLESPSSHFEW